MCPIRAAPSGMPNRWFCGGVCLHCDQNKKGERKRTFMKKAISLTLALVMALSLVSCGSKDSDGNSSHTGNNSAGSTGGSSASQSTTDGDYTYSGRLTLGGSDSTGPDVRGCRYNCHHFQCLHRRPGCERYHLIWFQRERLERPMMGSLNWVCAPAMRPAPPGPALESLRM